MSVRFLIFFSVATTIILGAHGYVGWRLISPTPWSSSARTAAWVAVFCWALLVPAALAGRFVLTGTARDVVSWAGYLAMGVFSFTFVLTVLRDIGFGWAGAAGVLHDPERRRALLHTSNLAVLGTTGVLSAWGVWQARRKPTIVDVVVRIDNLPAALEGFTIAQITDVHIGPTIKRDFIERVVAAVNEIGADIVAVTGDLVDGTPDELREHAAPLAQMRGKHGVFYVTGNHEYYSGADAWVAEASRLGMRPLMNEHVVIERDGAKLLLAGVTDYNAAQINPSQASDPVQALLGAPVVDLKVLLAHQPRSAFAASKAGFDLQLSGHTHGGQFFPWMFFVRFQQPFTAGLNRMDQLQVYTSCGTGYWGPPMRVGAPAEVTRLRLVRA
jgi:uncharacterized protein